MLRSEPRISAEFASALAALAKADAADGKVEKIVSKCLNGMLGMRRTARKRCHLWQIHAAFQAMFPASTVPHFPPRSYILSGQYELRLLRMPVNRQDPDD
jgi:hypothetical protein